jgi:hypothetical protein
MKTVLILTIWLFTLTIVNGQYYRLPSDPNEQVIDVGSPTKDFIEGQGPTTLLQDANYDEINFDHSNTQLGWLKRIQGINIYGDNTRTISFGPITSESDVPKEMNGKYFKDIIDMTAYLDNNTNSFTHSPVNSLISIVVDKGLKRIAFFKDGNFPIFYPGNENHSFKFKNPLAIHKIGAHIYILDKVSNTSYKIVVLKVPRKLEEAADISYESSIDINATLASSISCLDITGYNTKTHNILFVSTTNGLYRIKLNLTDGLVDVSAPNQSHLFSSFEIPEHNPNSIKTFSTNYFEKIDCQPSDISGKPGVFIALDMFRNVTSFPLQELENNINGEMLIAQYYQRLPSGQVANNLAYMAYEVKWYLTSPNGYLHSLNRFGKYLGGWGKPIHNIGSNEEPGIPLAGKGIFYRPCALTPNPILDINNPYKCQFVIDNKWTKNSGFMLLEPSTCISNAKIYESKPSQPSNPLLDGKITIVFATTNSWRVMKNAKSFEFKGIFLNGSSTRVYQKDILEDSKVDLSDFSNLITFNPTSAQNIVRGWNQFILKAKINLNRGAVKNISFTGWFYWLPSSFSASSTVSLSDATINQSEGQSSWPHFIYKSIYLSQSSVFQLKNRGCYVSKDANLIIDANCCLIVKMKQFLMKSLV